MKTQYQTAATIANQARRLGYTVDEDSARTGTIYLTLTHPKIDGDKGVRIGDHEANEARYVFRVNRRPDLDVEPGFQVDAVRMLAEWIGVAESRVPYLRRAATLAKKDAEAAKAAESTRQAANAARKADRKRLYAAASAEDQAKARHYAALTGKKRKRYGARHAAALQRAGARN